MEEQIPDVVRAKRFELVDDHGTVRATLGFEVVTFESGSHKSTDMAPSLVLMDEGGEWVARIGLDTSMHLSCGCETRPAMLGASTGCH